MGANDFSLDYENALAFLNPDGRIVLITSNETEAPEDITVNIGGKSQTVTLKPKSFNTFVLGTPGC